MDYISYYGNSYGENHLDSGIYLNEPSTQPIAIRPQHVDQKRTQQLQLEQRYGVPVPFNTEMATLERFNGERDDNGRLFEVNKDNIQYLIIVLLVILIILLINQNNKLCEINTYLHILVSRGASLHG